MIDEDTMKYLKGQSASFKTCASVDHVQSGRIGCQFSSAHIGEVHSSKIATSSQASPEECQDIRYTVP